MLAAGNAVAAVVLIKLYAGELQSVLGHGYIGLGLKLAGDGQAAVALNKGQSHEQAGNVLGGHVAGERILAGSKLSGAIQLLAIAL